MLLFEAKGIICKRKFPSAYEGMVKAVSPKKEADAILAQCDADIVAIRCIEAQQRVADLLNEFWDGIKETDTFSARLVYEMIYGLSIEAKFDADGMVIMEDEANDRDSDKSKSDNS